MRPAGYLAAGLIAASIPAASHGQEDLQRCVWACLAEFGPNTNAQYHQCVDARCTPVSATQAEEPAAWSFIDQMVAQALDIRPGEAGATLLADHPDPAVAMWALGFHYFESRTGGNAMGLNIGLFQRRAGGWQHVGPVEGLFGVEPRDPVFPSGRIELTTTTLGPNDPRCCPTAEARWSVDTVTRQAVRLK